MPSTKKLLQAAAGSAGGDNLYVEDVFSTYLYTGNGSTQTITNGIDLAGEGGAIWFKSRSTATNHRMFDTERGRTVALTPDTTAANGGVSPAGNDLASFNSDGFTVGVPYHYGLNTASRTYASWSFRKAEKFFDVVTYTGTGVARTIAHNLGSVPGMIICKSTSAVADWITYHVGTNATNPQKYHLKLNGTNAAALDNDIWDDTKPTATEFSLDTGPNANGTQYVAYLFASDAGGFGDDGDESIIKCGSFNSTALTNLGWEPQWVMMKRIDSTSDWFMFDTMRGLVAGGTGSYLEANTTQVDTAISGACDIEATGFTSGQSGTYIYIAIRRPMKTPESGTEVFAPTATSVAAGTAITTGFATDFQICKYRGAGSDVPRWTDRLRGFAETDSDTMPLLYSSGTNAEVASNDTANTIWNTGFKVGATLGGLSVIYYSLKRASGFMDIVAYTGTGGNKPARPHNLTVAPELVIVKSRSLVKAWFVLSTSLGKFQFLNLADPFSTTNLPFAFGDGSSYVAPTATDFTVGSSLNGNTSTFITYLFATLAGVSKVGTYTGTAATLNVDCGFSAGARFILIKRTDSTGDWYYWDSARGIVAGNDPYLLLNSSVGEVTNTDYIDPLNAGFTVTSSAPAALNASSGTYLFLAIA